MRDPFVKLPSEVMRDQRLTAPVWYIGLDLGQAADYTALAVLRAQRKTPQAKPDYEVGYLDRFPIGTPYPRIVSDVVDLTRRPELQATDWHLVPDATGVGRPVIDLLKELVPRQPRRLHPVTITGGSQASTGAFGLLVPKRDLVMSLKVLLENERLRFAGGLPHTKTLVSETLAFRVKITAAANDTYGAWREGEHDDLVLAVAMAAWFAERQSRKTGSVQVLSTFP
jgi:hypothetical protein